MYILGINAAYHESSACLIKDGILVAAVEEERFNRIKHSKSAAVDNVTLPNMAISYCLQQASMLENKPIDLKDIDHIGYSLDPKMRYIKNLRHEHAYPIPENNFGTISGELIFLEQNINLEKKLRQASFKKEFHFLNHHDCHAASAFLVSPYDEAAVLVVDGIGEYETTTFYKGKNNRLQKIGNLVYPNSLGFLWEKFCEYLGFSKYDACKVMGLASYGDPDRFRKGFEKIISYNECGQFRIADELLQFRSANCEAFKEIFNLEKRNEAIKDVAKNVMDYADVAATLQRVTEEIIKALVMDLKRKTGLKNLCLAGGVALNCVANSNLMRERLYDNIFIQPAANDAGTSLGAAFFIWNELLQKPRIYVLESAYLGPSFTDDEIREALDKRGLRYSPHARVAEKTARLIANENIVAWFKGPMEWGPRSLGNRSILADPRKEEVVNLLNNKVKHREPFRPFCPSILENRAKEWFRQIDYSNATSYMLSAVQVRPEKKELIPAVTHFDGTSRVQVVSKETNDKFYDLISNFEKLTGVPIVLNTSFNDQEHITCTPADAINTFLNNNIDYLVIGNFIVSKEEN